jgi:hypothetical protein
VLNPGATTGNTITSPTANAPSSIDVDGNLVGVFNPEVPGSTAAIGGASLTGFGTGRVRRFAPEASGALATRLDSGVVSLGGVPRTVGAELRNITGADVAGGADATFYDGLANVGVVTLRVFTPLSFAPDEYVAFNQRIHDTPPADRPADLQAIIDARDPNDFFEIRPGLPAYTGISTWYQPGQVTRIAVSSRDTPNFTTVVPQNPGQEPFDLTYNGSTFFEIGLRADTPTDGRVAALQGPSGLIALRSAAPDALSGPDLVGASDPGGCIETLACRPYSPAPNAGTGQTVVEGAPDRTPVPVGVFIIDKVTESSDEILTQRGIEAGERFFVIGGTPIPAAAGGALPGPGGVALPAGTVTRFAISDGLNPLPSGGFATGATIEAQFQGPGRSDQPAAFNRFNAFRPEETFIPAAARGDTHLLVVADAGAVSPAFRADLQVDAEGRSSASVAVGGIAPLPLATDPAQSLALSGSMVGAARGVGRTDDERSLSRSSAALASNLGSLGTNASGIGEHMFGGSDRAPGQVGYFAVSQADTRLGLPGTAEGAQPGSIGNLGGTGSAFAFTRLATNVGAPDLGLTSGPVAAPGLQGFAAALVEAVPAGASAASLHAGVGANLGDVTITPAGREISASIRLDPRAPGEISAVAPAAPPPPGRATRTLNFGGTTNGTPNTAVAAPNSFAAVIPGQAGMASVNADLATGIGTAQRMPASGEHLAWGYFLGDLVPAAPNAAREFSALGFWVAGRPVGFDTLQTLTGSATYSGGMIGNVADAGGLRTRVGSFTHDFNFGTRQGSFGAQFDGAGFSAGTSLRATGLFDGSVTGASGRTLSVQGGFFHNPPAAVSNSTLPRATGGVFGITGPGYGANGVFVGTR